MDVVSGEGWLLLGTIVLSHAVHLAVVRAKLVDLCERVVRLENMHLGEPRTGRDSTPP